MTDKTLLELAKRVESLDGPCREADRDIWQSLHPAVYVKIDHPETSRYTASLDAVMALVDSDAMAIGIIFEAIERLEDAGWPKGEWAKQLPRYVVAAALRAKDATNGQ